MRSALRKIVYLLVAAFASTSTLLASFSTVAAVSIVTSPPPASSPDLLITSIAGSASPFDLSSKPSAAILDDLEIYNQTSSPINLDGWQFSLEVKDSGVCASGRTITVKMSTGWILAKHYFTFQRDADLATPGAFSLDSSLLSHCTVSPWLDSVQLPNSTGTEQIINIPPGSLTPGHIAQHRQRSNSASSPRTISSDFVSDYKVSAINTSTSLISDPLYVPPADTGGLQILEILPNAQECSPTDSSLTCGDYIKIFNPTNKPINLAMYRLRDGYKGQSSSISNTFTWGRDLDPSSDELVLNPHSYYTLTARNDSEPLSLTDSGNYVWVEDAYGVKIYDPIVAYPSASSTTKVGQAWALNGDVWQWTSTPQPEGPNYFPPVNEAVQTTSSASSSLQACAANQYRSPLTNRCRLLVAAAVLAPCRSDQVRSPETNRCKSITTSTGALTPCKAGESRNPQTNRCRSVLGVSTTLKPCQTGWERNPATNRCRKTTSQIASVRDVKAAGVSSGSNHLGWLISAGAAAAAIGYGIYEWRQEISLKLAGAHSKLAAISLAKNK